MGQLTPIDATETSKRHWMSWTCSPAHVDVDRAINTIAEQLTRADNDDGHERTEFTLTVTYEGTYRSADLYVTVHEPQSEREKEKSRDIYQMFAYHREWLTNAYDTLTNCNPRLYTDAARAAVAVVRAAVLAH